MKEGYGNGDSGSQGDLPEVTVTMTGTQVYLQLTQGSISKPRTFRIYQDLHSWFLKNNYLFIGLSQVLVESFGIFPGCPWTL